MIIKQNQLRNAQQTNSASKQNSRQQASMQTAAQASFQGARPQQQSQTYARSYVPRQQTNTTAQPTQNVQQPNRQMQGANGTQQKAPYRSAQPDEYPEVDMRQIARIDCNGSFIEVLKNGFDLKKGNAEGKICMGFAQLDASNRQTAYRRFYLDMMDWLSLDEYIRHGEFVQDYINAKNEQAQTNASFAKPVFTDYRGYDDEQGQTHARIFELVPGNKNDSIVFVYKETPGARDPRTGAVKPTGGVTLRIQVSMTLNAMIGLIKVVSQEIQAFKTGEEMKRLFGPRFDRLEELMTNGQIPQQEGSGVNVQEIINRLDWIIKRME